MRHAHKQKREKGVIANRLVYGILGADPKSAIMGPVAPSWTQIWCDKTSKFEKRNIHFIADEILAIQKCAIISKMQHLFHQHRVPIV